MRRFAADRRLQLLTEDRFAWVWLAAAMAVAAVLILWLNRGTTFWLDELAWFLESPSFDLKSVLQPHLGHLVLTTHVTYKVLLELFGDSYLPFRLLGPATLFLTVALLFTFIRRRVGGFVALAPCVLLLFFGADVVHVLAGNAYTVLLAVALGLGAFLALEREDRRGDIWACVFLCLGVVTYSFALPFVVGAAIWIGLGEDRKRAWVVVLPAVIYGSWWLWSRTLPPPPQGHETLLNLLVVPAWAFQSLSAALTAFTGLSYQFPAGIPAPQAGPALAIAAFAAVGLRLRAGAVPKPLWAAIGVVVGIWTLGALTAGGIRFPENPRYFYPVGIGMLLIASESLRGIRWSRSATIALYVVVAAGLGTNLLLLRDGAAMLRNVYAPNVRASFTALDIAGSRAKPRFEPAIPVASAPGPLGVSFDIFEARGDSPVEAYLAAAKRYGSLGDSAAWLRAQEDAYRVQADAVLAGVLGLRLTPAGSLSGLGGCRRVVHRGGKAQPAVVPRGGALLELSGSPIPAAASIGRFADGENVPLGDLSPSDPVMLRIPTDRVAEPWRVSIAGDATLIVCPLR
jgi:hypothetical protein